MNNRKRSTNKERGKPSENRVTETEGESKAVEKNFVVNAIEGSADVKGREKSHFAVVHGSKDVR